MHPLYHIEEIAHENFVFSSKYLGNTSILDSKVGNCYGRIAHIIANTLDIKSETRKAFAHFVLCCQVKSKTALINIMRGQITEGFHDTRFAIEACAFLCRIHKHPDLADDWILAGDDDVQYGKYRRKFGGNGLWSADQKNIKVLYEFYDKASKFTHPSIYATGRKLKIIDLPENKTKFEFHIFELTPEKQSQLPLMFLWTIEAHIQIIITFLEMLGDLLKKDKDFQSCFSDLQQRFLFEKGQWKPVIDGVTLE